MIPRVLRGFAQARVLAEKCQRILVVPKLMARVPLWGRLILGMSHYKISQTSDAESRALGDETAISSDELISCRMVGIFGCSFFGQAFLHFSEGSLKRVRGKKEKKVPVQLPLVLLSGCSVVALLQAWCPGERPRAERS